MIHRTFGHYLVGDERVLLVEEEHAELLARRAGHGDPCVGLKSCPARYHATIGHLLAKHALGRHVAGMNRRGRRPVHAVDPLQLKDRGAEDTCQRAKPIQQTAGQSGLIRKSFFSGDSFEDRKNGFRNYLFLLGQKAGRGLRACRVPRRNLHGITSDPRG